jgi:hypothetical protein
MRPSIFNMTYSVHIRIMDWVAGQYAIYGPDDVILNKEGRMQMMYNIRD